MQCFVLPACQAFSYNASRTIGTTSHAPTYETIVDYVKENATDLVPLKNSSSLSVNKLSSKFTKACQKRQHDGDRNIKDANSTLTYQGKCSIPSIRAYIKNS